MTDVIDHVLGLAPGDAIYELRRERPTVVEHLQGSYDALYSPAAAQGSPLSTLDRAAVGYRVSLDTEVPELAAHYRNEIGDDELADAVLRADVADERLRRILQHASAVTIAPRTVTQADLFELEALGLGVPGIVTLSQLISFTNFQVRVAAALELMKG